MFRKLQGPAAEFRQELRAVLPAGPQFPEIDMQAFHVALFLGKPAGSAVDEPGIVQHFQPAVRVIRAELAPSLVEDGPEADTGMVPEQPDGSLHCVQEVLPGSRVPVEPGILPGLESGSRKDRVTEKTVFPAVHHVLENNHAEPVTVIVELFWLDLDMLSQHIEAEGFHGQNVFFITVR